MAEITPTPRQGVHTTFAAFGTTERFAEITPTPRQGVHTVFTFPSLRRRASRSSGTATVRGSRG